MGEGCRELCVETIFAGIFERLCPGIFASDGPSPKHGVTVGLEEVPAVVVWFCLQNISSLFQTEFPGRRGTHEYEDERIRVCPQGCEPHPVCLHVEKSHASGRFAWHRDVHQEVEQHDYQVIPDCRQEEYVFEATLWCDTQGQTARCLENYWSHPEGGYLLIKFVFCDDWIPLARIVFYFINDRPNSFFKWSPSFWIVLCFPQEVLDSILGHVGAASWERCVWSDENLSSKKMYPGFQFAGKGQWAARLRTGAANYHPDVNVFSIRLWVC